MRNKENHRFAYSVLKVLLVTNGSNNQYYYLLYFLSIRTRTMTIECIMVSLCSSMTVIKICQMSCIILHLQNLLISRKFSHYYETTTPKATLNLLSINNCQKHLLIISSR